MFIIFDLMFIILKENYIIYIKFFVIYFVVYYIRIFFKIFLYVFFYGFIVFFFFFGVQYSDFQGFFVSIEGFYGEAGRCFDLVVFGFQIRFVGADTVWVEAWFDGSFGFQFGFGELGQVGYYGQFVYFGIGDFFGFNELL